MHKERLGGLGALADGKGVQALNIVLMFLHVRRIILISWSAARRMTGMPITMFPIPHAPDFANEDEALVDEESSSSLCQYI